MPPELWPNLGQIRLWPPTLARPSQLFRPGMLGHSQWVICEDAAQRQEKGSLLQSSPFAIQPHVEATRPRQPRFVSSLMVGSIDLTGCLQLCRSPLVLAVLLVLCGIGHSSHRAGEAA